MKARVSLWSQKGPFQPPKPLQNPWLLRQHTATAQFFQLTDRFRDTGSFVCSLHCSPLWVEISKLAYETNTNCWSERFSVPYCTHIVQTMLMFNNRRYPQKIDIYSYRRSHRHASGSAGVLCRGCGAVKCNTLLMDPESVGSRFIQNVGYNFTENTSKPLLFCNIYIHSNEIHNVVALIKCLLILRCQFYMFRTVTVHPQELLFRYCMCRLWYVLISPAGTTLSQLDVSARTY